ncbi:hypothetical protein O181_016479 [Austropuccinia psidii MF-1]|uniref:Integrase catalytic domain-containing protein n=1 Tax=Austropuccinia psidii MF-1 TaxID=1389203 RepID=A0A9Q3C3Y3_9BASI|nr:hypothetical protein [Austropuccinia psidii MF-1]
MDSVTGLILWGKANLTPFLGIVERFIKSFRFPSCHNGNQAMDTEIIFFEILIAHCGIPRIIIMDRDPKFTSEFWTNPYYMFGTKLAFSTASHSQIDGLAGRSIKAIEAIFRRFCAYGMKYKDHYWVTQLPPGQMAYNTSDLSVTVRTPATL